MNKFFERRRNEFHATSLCSSWVRSYSDMAQGEGWDGNRSVLAQQRMASGELDTWESHDVCQSRRERESASECISTINVEDILTSRSPIDACSRSGVVPQMQASSGICSGNLEALAKLRRSQERTVKQLVLGMIVVWQGNEAWEVQRACKRVLLVGWTTPGRKECSVCGE